MPEAATSRNSLLWKTVSGLTLGSVLKLPPHSIQTSLILVILDCSLSLDEVRTALPSFLIHFTFPLVETVLCVDGCA